MITKEMFENIRNKYGDYSSWAIWQEGNNSIFNKDKQSIFDPDRIDLTELKPNIVLVGLNVSRPLTDGDFCNFHDARPQSKDSILRNILNKPPFRGAYMTDIVKGVQNAKSSEVVKILNKTIGAKEKIIKAFEDELNCLGVQNTLIVAFGNDAHDILHEALWIKYNIEIVTHYSYRYGGNITNTLEKEFNDIMNKYFGTFNKTSRDRT